MLKCLLAASILAATISAQTPATFQGVVADAITGKPIAKAFVSATRTTLPPVRLTVQTAADGSFAFNQLPAATYQLCVEPTTEGYLDPCVWSPPPPPVTLAAGERSSGNILKIKAGFVLKIHVADPQQLLWKKSSTGALPHLAMGVRTPQAALHAARLSGVTTAGNDYQVTIPLDTDLVFSINSFSLSLAGTTGAAMANSTDQHTFSQATGALAAASFSYTVTGLLHP